MSTTTRAKGKVFLNNKRKISFTSKNSSKSIQSEKQILNKGPWTDKEDQLLRNWIEKNGASNWTKCSEYIKGRTGKQCREHWNNSLDPKLIKGQWTSEEDLLIMIFYEKYGGSWKKIIPIFEKRTENSIKNRFFSQLRKIASKNQRSKKKEYSYNLGLKDLKNFLPLATDMAKKKFFDENIMSEKEFDEYIIKIDNMVKNKKKGTKFINLNIIKNSKNTNKIFEIKGNIEDNMDENEENVQTAKKQRRKRKKILNKIKNKQKEEKIIIKDDADFKEELITYEETINPITLKLDKKKDKDEVKNNEDDKNKNNKIFKSKKSKQKIIFKNETQIEEKKEKPKSENDNFLSPYNKDINKPNNIYEINFINEINNKNKINVNNYNGYKIKINEKEDDTDSKASLEEMDKQIKNAEKQAISRHLKCKNISLNRSYDSKKIDNDINKGKIINPFISFDHLDIKEKNINRNTLNRRKYHGINCNKDFKDFNYSKNISYNNNSFGDCNWRCSYSGIQPNFF